MDTLYALQAKLLKTNKRVKKVVKVQLQTLLDEIDRINEEQEGYFLFMVSF